MNVFIVMVKTEATAGRWIDSIFISASAADERAFLVRRMMISSGRRVSPSTSWAHVVDAQLEDAKEALSEARTEPTPPRPSMLKKAPKKKGKVDA